MNTATTQPHLLIVNESVASGTMAGIRSRRLIRGLLKAGWRITVLAHCAPASVTESDQPTYLCARSLNLALLFTRLRHWNRAARTNQTGTPPNLSHSIRLSNWVSRWTLIPDKFITWYAPAVRAGKEYLEKQRVDLIFSTIAPRTNALVGRALSKAFRIPLILEYRDLWTGNDYQLLAPPTALHRTLHSCMERACLRQAQGVIGLSQGICDHLNDHFSDLLTQPAIAHYNFYEPDEYPSTERPPPPRPFVLSYVGALYAERSPVVFFRGLRQFLSTHELTPDHWRFQWIGSGYALGDIEGLMTELELSPYIAFRGTLPHQKALHCLQTSDFSLIIQAPQDYIHVASKIFEAMGAKIPCLVIAPPCELADIVRDSQAGIIAAHDPDSVAAALEQAWLFFQKGQPWTFNEKTRRSHNASHALDRLDTFLRAQIRRQNQIAS